MSQLAQVIPFPHVNGAAATSSTTVGLTRAELRDVTWMNFYADERRRGVRPDLAHQRADEHAKRFDEHAKRFDELVANIGQIMSEVG